MAQPGEPNSVAKTVYNRAMARAYDCHDHGGNGAAVKSGDCGHTENRWFIGTQSVPERRAGAVAMPAATRGCPIKDFCRAQRLEQNHRSPKGRRGLSQGVNRRAWPVFNVNAAPPPRRPKGRRPARNRRGKRLTGPRPRSTTSRRLAAVPIRRIRANRRARSARKNRAP